MTQAISSPRGAPAHQTTHLKGTFGAINWSRCPHQVPSDWLLKVRQIPSPRSSSWRVSLFIHVAPASAWEESYDPKLFLFFLQDESHPWWSNCGIWVSWKNVSKVLFCFLILNNLFVLKDFVKVYKLSKKKAEKAVKMKNSISSHLVIWLYFFQ